MSTVSNHLRLSHADLGLHEVLQHPVSVLLGVDADAAAALDSVGIQSVFDLGSSMLFAQAASAIASASSSLGSLPSDLLKAGSAVPSLDEVPSLPLEALRGVPDNVAATLKSALDVETLRDLAYWPPRQVARAWVSEAAGTDIVGDADLLAEKLRPSMGEYPTERVYYDKLLMFGGSSSQDLEPLSGRISLQPTVEAQTGSQQLVVGALLTMSQSWFAQGITLGHMIHSLALAPGEATRIVMVDWSRQDSGATSESIAESERLDNAANHSRAISEVQNAVASEMQHGESMSDGWAKSTSESSGAAGSIGGGVAGFMSGVAGVGGFSVGASLTEQEAQTRFEANSASCPSATGR
jgi:hypothetical protein